MRTTYITTGFMTAVLVLVLGLSAAAQTSATSPSPQVTPSQAAPPPSQTSPSQGAPQQEPQAAPSQAPQQEPSQSAPSQPPAGQSPQSSQAPSRSDDDNPLNLTDEQKTKLRPIIADENQQMEAVRNDSTLTTDQKVAKANQIRETASPKIKAVLTPEQLQKLADLQQKARQQQQQSAPSSDAQKPQK